MPPLYKFDNFHECSVSGNLYCVVNSVIKPDYSSSLYNHILEFSKETKVHLRHDNLQRGLCMKDCKLKVYNEENKGNLYFEEEFTMDSKARKKILCLWSEGSEKFEFLT